MGKGGKTRVSSRRSKTGETPTVADKSSLTGEAEKLLEEFEKLDAERETLRKELVDIDKKYSKGKLKPVQRDTEYRTRLARAGQIRLRQMEIRARLKEIGRPLPPARFTTG